MVFGTLNPKLWNERDRARAVRMVPSAQHSGARITIERFPALLHMPAPLTFLAIVAEFLGRIGLVLGFLTRIAAFGIGVNMIVAIVTVHGAYGLFMRSLGEM